MSQVRKAIIWVFVAVAAGFAGGIVGGFLFRQEDETEGILNLILEIAAIRHDVEDLKGRLDALSQETTTLGSSLSIFRVQLENLDAKLRDLEETVSVPMVVQPESPPSSGIEGSEFAAPSFEILDFHLKHKDRGVLIVVAIRNASDLVASFMPFVRCNEGPKYLWHKSIGSLYLAPGEEDQLIYDPYWTFDAGHYTFTLTYVRIEAISEEGKHIGAWDVPLEGYTRSLEIGMNNVGG